MADNSCASQRKENNYLTFYRRFIETLKKVFDRLRGTSLCIRKTTLVGIPRLLPDIYIYEHLIFSQFQAIILFRSLILTYLIQNVWMYLASMTCRLESLVSTVSVCWKEHLNHNDQGFIHLTLWWSCNKHKIDIHLFFRRTHINKTLNAAQYYSFHKIDATLGKNTKLLGFLDSMPKSELHFFIGQNTFLFYMYCTM